MNSWGIRIIIIYIDSMLILAESRDTAAQHWEVLLFLPKTLGFIFNM